MIMEPLLGGKLATGLPKEAVSLFSNANPSQTPAAWGLNWLWNQNEVTCVLSGTNTASQIEENIIAANNAHPLSEKELSICTDVIAIFDAAYKIKYTDCNYCMPCPKGINIPGCFAAYNTSYSQNFATGMQQFMTSTATMSKKPTAPGFAYNAENAKPIAAAFGNTERS